MSRRSEGIDPRERGGDMSDAVGWLVGIGCAVGLLVSIVTLLPFLEWQSLVELAGFIVEQPSLLLDGGFFLLIGPLGYLLVGWICVRHWKSVSQQDAVLVGTVALVGTWLAFAVFPPFEMWSRAARVLLVGFWMLNGFGLAWLLRKRRRIMREANAE